MHKKYGPIIRINPYELHVSSPDFIEKLYTGPGKRRHRWGWMTAQFGVGDAIFGTTDHESHRIRRAAVNPFLSKGAVRKLQPIVDERMDALLGRFREFQASGEPISLNYAFAAYTNGLIYLSHDARMFVDCVCRHCARIRLCEIGSPSRSV
jgi:cytochrome P450